tara:strand:- start:117 stop:860 length:744 start_codon:yes stop_codon:yes gene_type:complete
MNNKIQDAAIIYQGVSAFDGKPIAAIATGIKRKSKNSKTGAMVQLWIISQDLSPYDASQASSDTSNCGDCKHRHSLGGGCYVDLLKAPNSVYNCYKRGGYEDINAATLAHLSSLKVRLGAYGDMFAIPYKPLANFLKHVRKRTGYTHAWQNLDKRSLELARKYFVASVDNFEELVKAQDLELSTFRVKAPKEVMTADKFGYGIECLNTTHDIECADCLLCNGRDTDKTRPRNIFIDAHGNKLDRFNV